MDIFRKKKTVLILVAALLFSIAVSGCGRNAPGAWKSGTPLDKDAVIIGMIYLDSAENGYSQAHDLGIQETQRELGLRNDQLIRKFNINEADTIMTENAIRELIDEGANIVVATSWGHMDACENMASEYPNVVFAHASGYKSNDTNFTNYFGRIYQARYLSGIVAGLTTETNKIGFVAAQDESNSEVTGGLNAFAMGVESVNTGAKIFVEVTYSWYNPAGERQAAQKLLDAGCDVIAQHCDTAEPQIAAAAAGKRGIGYNVDMSAQAPDTVLTSVIWNWGAYYTHLIGGVIDGSFTTEPYFGGLAEGLVDIVPPSAALTMQETQAAIDRARERILGGFNVFDGVMETNDGRTVGTESGTLPDSEITGGIDWYYRNITKLD